MNRADAIGRLTAGKVGQLATFRPEGRPHVVPITFAVTGESIVTMIDHKPKTTMRLQRLRNLEHNPNASVLVHHYDDDWTRLWWVRADGEASVSEAGSDWAAARDALVAKYEQYSSQPPLGPAIVIHIGAVNWWEGTP